MDPEGNYESRLSYTTKSSRDVNDGDLLVNSTNNKPFDDEGLSASDHKHEEKERVYDYFGASAPPLPGVPVPIENTCSTSPPEAAEEDTCTRKPSPVANREVKALSPPDEPVLDSVVVPINSGAIDALPVALPIVTNAAGGGLDATIPLPSESPETAQPSSDENPAAEKQTRTKSKACSTKKIILLCLVVVLVAGLAATITILLWPDQSPDDQQEEPYIYNSNDEEATIEPSPTEEPTYESTAETTPGTTDSVTSCSKDVKLCSDGSSVSRDPSNNCSFRPCPVVLIPSCTVNGREYSIGDVYAASDGCNTCACIGNGEITCTTTVCPRDNPEPDVPEPDIACPVDVRSCNDGSFVSRDPANNCNFPPCPVIPILSCTANGQIYNVGETYSVDCNTCACVANGNIVCTTMICPRPEEPEPDPEPDEKPSKKEMYIAYYNTNNRDGKMDCCDRKSQACCRCCKDECAMKEKGDLDDIPSCKRECREYYGRDTCSKGDAGPFDCCTQQSRSCCRCCMEECGKRYKGDLDLIEDCKKFVCRDSYYGVRDPDVCKE